MGALLITPPTLEPLTLAEAKAHLRVEVPDDDALIASYIIAAREWVEGQTRRALMTQTWDFTFDWDWPTRRGRIYIRLPVAPVQSVTSVKYVDESGVTQTLSAATYQAVVNVEHPRIEAAYDSTWPSVRNQADAVTIRAVCGYGVGMSDVPQPLRQAIKLLTAHWYENREPVNVGNLTTSLQFMLEALVSPYSRVTF